MSIVNICYGALCSVLCEDAVQDIPRSRSNGCVARVVRSKGQSSNFVRYGCRGSHSKEQDVDSLRLPTSQPYIDGVLREVMLSCVVRGVQLTHLIQSQIATFEAVRCKPVSAQLRNSVSTAAMIEIAVQYTKLGVV